MFFVLPGQAVVRFEIVVEWLRPRREYDGLAALVFRHVLGVTHSVPQFLRDERQKRMKQAQRVAEDEINHGQSVRLVRLIIRSSPALRDQSALTICAGSKSLSRLTSAATG